MGKALEGVRVQESLLERVEVSVRLDTFDGGDWLTGGDTDGCTAGPHWGAIHENGAGAALAFAATVFGAGQVEFVAQDAEQGAFGVDGD